jgi:hypothetical protein
LLLAPGKGAQGEAVADASFGRAVIAMLRDPQMRAQLGVAASKIARERCAPEVVQRKIANAFQFAQDHALACGLRPAVDRSVARQLLTTWKHFQPWMTVMGGIYLAGHLRPSTGPRKATALHGAISG